VTGGAAGPQRTSARLFGAGKATNLLAVGRDKAGAGGGGGPTWADADVGLARRNFDRVTTGGPWQRPREMDLWPPTSTIAVLTLPGSFTGRRHGARAGGPKNRTQSLSLFPPLLRCSCFFPFVFSGVVVVWCSVFAVVFSFCVVVEKEKSVFDSAERTWPNRGRWKGTRGQGEQPRMWSGRPVHLAGGAGAQAVSSRATPRGHQRSAKCGPGARPQFVARQQVEALPSQKGRALGLPLGGAGRPSTFGPGHGRRACRGRLFRGGKGHARRGGNGASGRGAGPAGISRAIFSHTHRTRGAARPDPPGSAKHCPRRLYRGRGGRGSLSAGNDWRAKPQGPEAPGSPAGTEHPRTR